MGNNKFTVLSLSQVYGEGRLDVFNKYGSEAEVTDFAISRGTDYYPLKGKYFAESGLPIESPLLDEKVCDYWTSTKVEGSVAKCYSYGRMGINREVAWSDNNGIRVVVPFEEIKDDITSTTTKDFGKGKVTIVTCGEYPQKVLGYREQEAIEELYENGELKPTGKHYSIWGYKNELFYDGTDRKFERDEYPEYEYNGMKFVKAKKAVFENGASRDIWAVVEPIEWLIDDKTRLAVTKKCVTGGVPISRKGIYLGNFENTMVQSFLTDEFAYDIFNKKNNLKNMLDETELLDTTSFTFDSKKKSL